jgi:tRNA (guanine37-N1)-methyltransferase
MVGYKQMLSGVVSDSVLEAIPNGFRVIGDIAIIQLPPSCLQYRSLVADAILSFRRNIRTVLVKVSRVDGMERRAAYELLFGSGTVTVHTEFGYRYMLDISRVFFNPALATERMRVARQVADGERVLIPYAGVGPFVVPVAAMGAHVTAVETSMEACLWLAANVRRNRVEENVLLIWGDILRIIDQLHRPFDRAIVPAPYGKERILEKLSPIIIPGGRVHLYLFKKPYQIDSLRDRFRETGYDTLSVRRCGNVAPGVSRFVFDMEKREPVDTG